MRKTRQQRGAEAYQTGLWAERLALCLLMLKMYSILGTRVKTAAGEVDILARRGRTLIIVEVKARRSKAAAAEALRPRQQVRLARAAEILLARTQTARTVRFDVVEITPYTFPRHRKDAWRP
ncbi:MAG: YraN family protein [Alphaproteobacteria bacterium]|nr:YraN family protein [Alphaproteobacteria bacterium]MBO6626891.1 YraN family protein [Alphaproteobacteria bacterium]MDF1627658.1 YraN family protein [Parvibaculaceae bacterium]